MAATGKTPILLYGSTTATNTPSAGNLTNSSDGCEIAINVADKNLFFKDSTNAVNTVPLRQSSASSNGWLSSTDWSTFNSKQPAGTYVTSVTGTAPVVSSGGTTPAISMAAASGSVNGYLTSTDWTTFNNKAPAFTYTTNYIPFGQGTTTPNQSANLVWDNANSRFGVNTSTPAYSMEVVTAGTFGAVIRTGDATAANNAGVLFRNVSSATTASRASYVYLDPNGANGSGGDYFYMSLTGDGTATIGNQISGTVNFINAGATKMSIGTSDVTVSSGNLVIGTSGKGIDFSATSDGSGTATSELLADYEEGTWTPVLDSATAGSGRATTVNSATYTKIGRQVSVQCYIKMGTLGTGGSGAWSIKGLPYTSKSSSYYDVARVGYAATLNATVANLGGYIYPSSTTITMTGSTGASTLPYGELDFATYVKANTELVISATYFV